MSYIKNYLSPTLSAEEIINRIEEEISALCVEVQYLHALGYDLDELSHLFKAIEYKKDTVAYIIAFHNTIIRD